MKLLIVDDEIVSRTLLERTVRDLGHDCLVASGGEEAWELIRRHTPDVVISDWIMPDVTGVDLCRRIRDDAATAGAYTYFILLTGLTSFENLIEGTKAGADDYLVKPLDVRQLEARLLVAERVTGLHHAIAERDAELQRLNGKLYEQARTDVLTGMGNRLRMDEDLERVHARAERYGHRYALALFDIDHFKAYNDRFGHGAGDEALRIVAHALRDGSRTGDGVYRYGGEELLVILAGQDSEGAVAAADRMRQAVAELALPNAVEGAGVLTISAGLAYSADAPYTEVLEAADRALYVAKEEGRNRVSVWEASLG